MSTNVTNTNASRRLDEIVEKAAQLFAKNGYEATGIRELELACGLGRGALYYHIQSKENLLYEISIRHVRTMVAVGEQIVRSSDDPETKLRQLGRALIGMIAKHLAEVTVFFREFHHLTGASRDELIAWRDRYEACWQSVLDHGVETGFFRQADSVTVKALLGMHNYSYLWIRPDGVESPDEIAGRLMDIALLGIGPVAEQG